MKINFKIGDRVIYDGTNALVDRWKERDKKLGTVVSISKYYVNVKFDDENDTCSLAFCRISTIKSKSSHPLTKIFV